MRVNRAFLLEHLKKLQENMPDVETELSESPPQTVRNLPTRPKQRFPMRINARQPQPEVNMQESRARSAQENQSIQPNGDGSHPSPQAGELGTFPQPETTRHQSSQPSQPVPTPPQGNANAPPATYAGIPQGGYVFEGPRYPPPAQPLPFISALPNGTSVRLVRGEGGQTLPQPAPWTIHDLDPRHHVIEGFNKLPLEVQEREIFNRSHLPFDIHGQPVIFEFNAKTDNYQYIFPSDPAWKNPVVGSERLDSLDNSKRQPIATHLHPLHNRSKPGETYSSAPADASGTFTAANR